MEIAKDELSFDWAPWAWLAWGMVVLGVLVVGLLQTFVWRQAPGQGPLCLLAAFGLGAPTIYLWLRWWREQMAWCLRFWRGWAFEAKC